MKHKTASRIKVAAVCATLVVALSGCNLINDMNPVQSDKKACDELSTLVTNLGQPNALNPEAALEFAAGLESKVRPNATTDFAKDVDSLIQALKATGEDSIFSQAGGALDVINFSSIVVSHCVDVSSGN